MIDIHAVRFLIGASPSANFLVSKKSGVTSVHLLHQESSTQTRFDIKMSLSSVLRQSNSEALSLSQRTAPYLQKHASTGTSTVPTPFLSYPESTDIWLTYEKLFLSCLRTGDDEAAFNCLGKLIRRFGATNERIMGLRGLYQEAVAKDDAALEKVLQEYDEILTEDTVNTVGVPEHYNSQGYIDLYFFQPVAKRRIALLRSLSRTTEAIDALTELVESSPTDIEAWTELSDLYLSQNLFPQAVFCLEEVLLVAPNAWNVRQPPPLRNETDVDRIPPRCMPI